MDENTHSIFFIIPFYNEDKYIKECLRSIEIYLDENVQVIIVNNSDKQTKIDLIVKDFRNVTVIKTDARIGFSRACNLGAKKAIERGAEYIICLNQDIILYKNFVSEILRPFKEEVDIVIAAPIQYTYGFKKIESNFIRWYLVQCQDLICDALNCTLKTKYELEYISGACFAIKTDFIKKYGFFDPIYFMYAEDEDLCRKVRYLGFKIVIVPNAKCSHYHSHTSSDKDCQRIIRLWQRRSRAIYQLKDIKNPFHKALSRLMYKNFIDYIGLIIKFKIIYLLSIIWVDVRLLFNLSKIFKSRKNELNILNSGA